jgi:hypothetical protein
MEELLTGLVPRFAGRARFQILDVRKASARGETVRMLLDRGLLVRRVRSTGQSTIGA